MRGVPPQEAGGVFYGVPGFFIDIHQILYYNRLGGAYMPADSINVRPMQTADIAYIISLLTDDEINAALHCGDLTRRKCARAFRRNLRDPDEKNFILCRGDTPVGWLKLNGLEGDMAWISMLVIHPAHQRQGIGSFAVRWGEDFAKSLCFMAMGIGTTADNLSARACYTKLGYVLTEEKEGVVGDGVRRPCLVFEKQLEEK